MLIAFDFVLIQEPVEPCNAPPNGIGHREVVKIVVDLTSNNKVMGQKRFCCQVML